MFGFDRHDIRLGFNLFAMQVRDRYLGSWLGSFWAVANPLFMLGIYTFVFGFVLNVRLPGAETTLGYVIWLISGYGPWIATNEALMASTGSVVGAVGLVKNLAFKTELLPIASAFVGLISLFVSLCFMLVLMCVEGNLPSWHLLWIPIVVALQMLLIIALGLWLSAVNVFVRDISQMLPNLLIIIMFATPIFYPIESMPEIVRKLTIANPFYVISEAYRSAILQHTSPRLELLAYVLLLSLLIFSLGLAAFRRIKGHFSSAL
jgi:lipopolysaccharide transport system permease protein